MLPSKDEVDEGKEKLRRMLVDSTVLKAVKIFWGWGNKTIYDRGVIKEAIFREVKDFSEHRLKSIAAMVSENEQPWQYKAEIMKYISATAESFKPSIYTAEQEEVEEISVEDREASRAALRDLVTELSCREEKIPYNKERFEKNTEAWEDAGYPDINQWKEL